MIRNWPQIQKPVAATKKVLAGSLLFAFLPLQFVTPETVPQINSEPWETQLVLAEASPELLIKPESEIKIEKTQSRFQEEQIRLAEEQRKKQLQLARQRQQGTVPAATDVSYEQKVALAQKAAATYGIPTELLIAVWKVESGMRWYTPVQSHMGATGPFQFMPGTWRRYAYDGNGDGVKDVQHAEDAAYGAANLLASNGASRGDYQRALFAYNHAQWYVDKVLKLAGM